MLSPPSYHLGRSAWCLLLQGSSSEAQRRHSGLCELAGSSDGTTPRRWLGDQPLVSDGLPAAPNSCHSLVRRGSAVASAHRKNPLAQEAGAGVWRSPEMAWWVRRSIYASFLPYQQVALCGHRLTDEGNTMCLNNVSIGFLLEVNDSP